MALGTTSNSHQGTNSTPTPASALSNLSPFTRGFLFLLFLEVAGQCLCP